MGIKVALYWAQLIAYFILEELSLGDIMTLLKLLDLCKGNYSLVEEIVHLQASGSRAIHKPHLVAHCVLIAIIHRGDLRKDHGGTQLQPADDVLAIVHARHLHQLVELLNPANNKYSTLQASSVYGPGRCDAKLGCQLVKPLPVLGTDRNAKLAIFGGSCGLHAARQIAFVEALQRLQLAHGAYIVINLRLELGRRQKEVDAESNDQ